MLFISDLPKFSAGTELVMTISIGLVAIVLLALGVATVYNALRERRRMKIEDAEEGKRMEWKERDIEVWTLIFVRRRVRLLI